MLLTIIHRHTTTLAPSPWAGIIFSRVGFGSNPPRHGLRRRALPARSRRDQQPASRGGADCRRGRLRCPLRVGALIARRSRTRPADVGALPPLIFSRARKQPTAPARLKTHRPHQRILRQVRSVSRRSSRQPYSMVNLPGSSRPMFSTPAAPAQLQVDDRAELRQLALSRSSSSSSVPSVGFLLSSPARRTAASFGWRKAATFSARAAAWTMAASTAFQSAFSPSTSGPWP